MTTMPTPSGPASGPTDDPAATAGIGAHPPSCGDLVGALVQADRRAVFAALVLGAASLGEVADAARLRPSAAAAALEKLAAVGLVVADRPARTYALVEDSFRRAITAEARVSGPGGDGAGAYFRRGRLTAVPGDAAVRARVLSVVADSFAPGAAYSEARVNALCGEWFDDWVGLRRALVDEGLLTRDPAGSTYQST